jgi:hypothetical protein
MVIVSHVIVLVRTIFSEISLSASCLKVWFAGRQNEYPRPYILSVVHASTGEVWFGFGRNTSRVGVPRGTKYHWYKNPKAATVKITQNKKEKNDFIKKIILSKTREEVSRIYQ